MAEGKLERAFGVVKSMNLTNIIIIALLIILAIPSYFAYRFISDADFRREFMSTAIILEEHVPCVVLEGHKYGGIKRHSILVVYGHDERFEKLVGLRSPSPLTFTEINDMCKKVNEMAKELGAK